MNAKRRIFLAATVGGAVAAAGALGWPREQEPGYGGKPLSEWLEIGYTSEYGSADEKQAEVAVRGIGTNALPRLLKAIAYTESPLRRMALRVEARVPRRVSRNLHLDQAARGSGGRRAEMAVFGFAALGHTGRPARPDLKRLSESPDSRVRARALAALVGSSEVEPDRFGPLYHLEY